MMSAVGTCDCICNPRSYAIADQIFQTKIVRMLASVDAASDRYDKAGFAFFALRNASPLHLGHTQELH